MPDNEIGSGASNVDAVEPANEDTPVDNASTVDATGEAGGGKPVAAPTDSTTRTFTQEQVNKIMRSRLERDRLSLFGRYGVKDRDGLDDLIGKAQSYDVMKERYGASKARIAELEERLAFVDNGINPDREDDIRAYFKGKGIGFSGEALARELSTHPEWRKAVMQDDKPKTTIEVLGVEHRDRNVPETESEKIKRIFGV